MNESKMTPSKGWIKYSALKVVAWSLPNKLRTIYLCQLLLLSSLQRGWCPRLNMAIFKNCLILKELSGQVLLQLLLLRPSLRIGELLMRLLQRSKFIFRLCGWNWLRNVIRRLLSRRFLCVRTTFILRQNSANIHRIYLVLRNVKAARVNCVKSLIDARRRKLTCHSG